MNYIEEIDKKRGGKVKKEKEVLRLPLHNKNYIENVNSKSPEAIFRVVSHGSGSKKNNSSLVSTGSAGTKNLLNYIARSGKGENELQLEDQDGIVFKGKDDVKSLYDEWSQDFQDRKVNGTKKPTKLMSFYLDKEKIADSVIDKTNFSQVESALRDHFGDAIPSNLKSNMHRYSKPRNVRHTTHIIISAKCDNTPDNVKRVDQAAREFLQERFGKDGYEYAFTTHKDTDNPHTHVIVKNKNRETGKKLRLDPVDLLYLRTEYAKSLEKNGIKHKATRRLDRLDTLEKISKGIEQVRENAQRFDGQLENRKRVNVPAKNNQLARQIDNLKKDVLNGFHKVTDKARVLKELKALEQEIKIDKKHTPSTVIDSTINMVSKETKELVAKATQQLKATPEKDREERLRRAEERKSKREAIAKISERKVKEINTAIDYIRDLKDADPESKKFAIQTLNKNKSMLEHLALTNARSVHIVKGEDKGRER